MKPYKIDWLIDWTIFKRFNTVLLHSLNLWAQILIEKFKKTYASWKKKLYGAQFLVVRLILQRLCDDNQCLILIFSVIYLGTASKPNRRLTGGSGFRPVSIETMTTAQNRTEPPVNRRLGFEAAP